MVLAEWVLPLATPGQYRVNPEILRMFLAITLLAVVAGEAARCRDITEDQAEEQAEAQAQAQTFRVGQGSLVKADLMAAKPG